MTDSETMAAEVTETNETRRLARVERLVQALTQAMHGLAREADTLEQLLAEAKQELAKAKAQNEGLRAVAEAAAAYVIARGTCSEEDCEAADRQLTLAAMRYGDLMALAG